MTDPSPLPTPGAALRAALEKIAAMKKCRGGGIVALHEYSCPYCLARSTLAALPPEMSKDIRAIVTAMREFERTAPSPQQTRTKSAREMVGYFAWMLEEALTSATLRHPALRAEWQIAENIIRHHTDRCAGDYTDTEPWCSCAPIGTPLCAGCLKLAAVIAQALRAAALPPEGRPPEDTDEERDIRALADKLEQAWRDGGVMRSHAGDLKRAADKLRILLTALNHAVKVAVDLRAEGRQKPEDDV